MRKTYVSLSRVLCPTVLFCIGVTALASSLPASWSASMAAANDDAFEKQLRPFLEKNCLKCHGNGKSPKGKVDLKKIRSSKDFQANPELISNLIDVLDSYAMPPETEPEIPDAMREKIIRVMKEKLAASGSQNRDQKLRIRRLNRFQYNNSVKDLFQLRMNVFALPEKLMTRNSNYLVDAKSKMPEQVRVRSAAINPNPGLRNVKSFPKDLRASHGFDNQANQLSLSPLLLDAFLRVSVSIVESPDFNPANVGIWKDFFEEPKTDQLPKEVEARLQLFLTKAFRRKISGDTLNRYVQFVVTKTKSGTPFPDAMKKVASAVLSSPLFLYRYEAQSQNEKQFELASKLSYFLWASCPDEELLKVAESGKLDNADVLRVQVDRMLADPKIERFLDSFPSQWLQLENVLAATPDPQKQRYFNLDKNHPASLQMLLEPLLLFDTVFVENRPVIELIAPDFSYQSEFLKTWYQSDLQPPRVDKQSIVKQNLANDQKRKKLSELIQSTRKSLQDMVQPIQQKILATKDKNQNEKPVDLKPIAAWEFDGDLKSSVGNLELAAHGKVSFVNGSVVLKKAYLLSPPLPVDLKAKSLEVWVKPHNLDQRGGGVMGIQGQGDFFDTIVLGERQNRHWISGSNGFSRTLDFPESTPEPKPNEMIHLVMVYHDDGTTQLFRNGQSYGKPFKKSRATFPKEKSKVIFGLRHLPAAGDRLLDVSIDRARLYDRALNELEVKAANQGRHLFVSDKELFDAMTTEQRIKQSTLKESIQQREVELAKIPKNQNPDQVERDVHNRYENELRNMGRSEVFKRIAASDPRYGGVITNAAIMSMTSGPKRTHPIARGAWIIEVIFNDPPPPPPNDIPPLNEDSGDQNLTIRERFRKHRENPDCAGCHSRLDPLGFAMENFDVTGRWRDQYENGRRVDMSGSLMKRHKFSNVVDFKKALVDEKQRFVKAFAAHLLRFAIARELSPTDKLVVDAIVSGSGADDYRIKPLIKNVILSKTFLNLDR